MEGFLVRGGGGGTRRGGGWFGSRCRSVNGDGMAKRGRGMRYVFCPMVQMSYVPYLTYPMFIPSATRMHTRKLAMPLHP